MPFSLVPDRLFADYRDVTPALLKEAGVTLLLTDLDYTLAPKSCRRPDEALHDWIAALRAEGIQCMIVSNNRPGHPVPGPRGEAVYAGAAPGYGPGRCRPRPHRYAGRQAADRRAGREAGGGACAYGGAEGRGGDFVAEGASWDSGAFQGPLSKALPLTCLRRARAFDQVPGKKGPFFFFF